MATTPGQHEAQAVCKAVMVKIRNFVLYGHSIDAFVTSLLRRDEPQAQIEAHPALLREGALPDLYDFVDKHIPAGMFATADEMQRWQTHEGLRFASDEQKMWFRMMSPWWRTKEVNRVRYSETIAA